MVQKQLLVVLLIIFAGRKNLYQIRIWQTSFPPFFLNPPASCPHFLVASLLGRSGLPPALPSF